MHVPQALAEARQARERAPLRGRGKLTARLQPFGQAHGFLEAVDDRELPVAQLADDHVEAVRAEIDGGDDGARRPPRRRRALRGGGCVTGGAGQRAPGGGRTKASPGRAAAGERRGAGTAGRGRGGVAHDALCAPQVLLVVDFRSHEVLHAHGIDQERHTLVLDLAVALLDLLVEREAVLESGATAARDIDAQLEIGVVLFLDELVYLARRGVGEDDRRLDAGEFGGLFLHSSTYLFACLMGTGRAGSGWAWPAFSSRWTRSSIAWPAGRWTSLPLISAPIAIWIRL